MKLNNKGFAITGILYGLLILFALLVGTYLTILTAKKNRLDGIVADIENEYNNKENISTYTLNLKKGTGVREIHYKVDSDSDYTSSTSDVSLSVNSGSTYYYYGVASSGYTMDDCTSSSHCSGTMETSAVTETLSATAISSGRFTVKIYVDGGGAYTDTATVAAGESYTTQFTTNTESITVSCTNDQVADWEINSYVATFKINSVTADTVCNVEWDY